MGDTVGETACRDTDTDIKALIPPGTVTPWNGSLSIWIAAMAAGPSLDRLVLSLGDALSAVEVTT